jgi:hypothetical protein
LKGFRVWIYPTQVYPTGKAERYQWYHTRVLKGRVLLVANTHATSLQWTYPRLFKGSKKRMTIITPANVLVIMDWQWFAADDCRQ